ncbi:MAG: aminotransferase class I/II-fold pyridoxal phosphate-dependent enzyme [Rhodocyclaceae bacterium]|nr:aminotransferase class I/II-fold pyridoxal phosphate-dependent enzyme [Rhodocyclaceae bacterium]
MKQPVSRILLLLADEKRSRLMVRGLNAAARSMDNAYGLRFSSVASEVAALDEMRRDGDVQAVLIDACEIAADSCAALNALLESIHRVRPHLDVYLLAATPREAAASLAECTRIKGSFMRDEGDWRGWFRIIQAELQKKSRTPFFDALSAYVYMAKDSWHTPGHSSGDSLRASPWASGFYDFLGENLLRADLSCSVDMLDSLLDPKGVIAEAQVMAAQAFGARQTFFATNGTSTANKVIFQTLLTPGDKLLLDRNCHKSVHHGVVLSGARPVYLNGSINRTYGLFGPVSKKTLFAAIAENLDAKALILTSCTYDGLRYDLPPIIAAAHQHGIKVIIDEAWYGHAAFHPEFFPTAIQAGADYATQSTHKVLSALSQASMIHVNDAEFDEHSFRENFNMHASTSPQYAIIASLDVGRKQAVMEGYKLLNQALTLAGELRDAIDATGIFRVLQLDDLLPEEVRGDGVRLDPTKITVDISGSGYSVEELQTVLFETFNIQVEKSTFNTITLLLTIGTTASKMSRLQEALVRLAREVTNMSKPVSRRAKAPDIAEFTRLRYLPRDAYYCNGENLPLLDAEGRPNAELDGRVCADQISPYPPGIPALVPGQEITMDIVRFLVGLLRHKRTDIHGLAHGGEQLTLRVMTKKEERANRALN